MKSALALAASLGFVASAQAQKTEPLSASPAPSVSDSQPQAPSAAVSGVTVTARRPTHVAAVTVTATDWCPTPDPARYPAAADPRVIDSYPAQGGEVAPGYVLVRVTFDAPMTCYSDVEVQSSDDDPCQPSGTWELPGRRSFLTQCRLTPGYQYKIRFRRSDGDGFVGLSGRQAKPFELDFTASDGPPTPSLQAAQADDPGPADATSNTAAYVTCTDTKGATVSHDCQHQVFRRPQPSSSTSQ